MVAEFIAIVETLSKCFYLIAITRQTDDVSCTIMFEVEYELLLFVVKCNSHSQTNSEYNRKDTKYFSNSQEMALFSTQNKDAVERKLLDYIGEGDEWLTQVSEDDYDHRQD